MASNVGAARRHPRLVLSDLLPGDRVRDVVLVLAGAGFVGLLAQITIAVHGSPVPITGQTLGVLLVGASLGWRRGLASLGLYLVAGAIGVPWFQNHTHGISMPSFGYVIGFVVAAGIVGALAERGGDRTPIRTIATMLIGNLVIYAFGLAYLMADLDISLDTAWNIGMKNYLVGDGLKILLAAGLLPGAWLLVGRRRRR